MLTPKAVTDTKKSEDEEEFMEEIFDYIDENHDDEESDGNDEEDGGNDEENEQITQVSFRKDKLKRMHFPRLEAGPDLIKLRACKFDTSSGETHSNDIFPI